MNLLPLILKKRDQRELSSSEIRDFVFSLNSKRPPADYQIASLLAFILARGMTELETLDLATAMKESGKPVEYKKGFPRDAFLWISIQQEVLGTRSPFPCFPLSLVRLRTSSFRRLPVELLGTPEELLINWRVFQGFHAQSHERSSTEFCGIIADAFYLNPRTSPQPIESSITCEM